MADAKQYIVIARTGASGSKRSGCRILEADAVYAAIYSKVFGPASRGQCEKFVRDNCG